MLVAAALVPCGHLGAGISRMEAGSSPLAGLAILVVRSNPSDGFGGVGSDQRIQSGTGARSAFFEFIIPRSAAAPEMKQQQEEDAHSVCRWRQASRSVSTRGRTSSTRTRPLTFRSRERLLSSGNRTLTCDLFGDRHRDFFGLRKATQDGCREAISLPEFCSWISRPTDCWNDSFCLIAIGTFSADCDTQTVMSKRRIGE
jgi:hypothetical protein